MLSLSSKVKLLYAPLYILSCLIAHQALAKDILIAGHIKNTKGRPIIGATISLKQDGSNITTTVFADENGEFIFPPLSDGAYHLWAQGWIYQTKKIDFVASENHLETIVLDDKTGDVARQLPGDILLAALPERTKDEARMKNLISKNCTGCHSASFPLQHRFDKDGWTKILTHMSKINLVGIYNANRKNGTIESHMDELAAYLAKARGPEPSAMDFSHMRSPPRGEAARVVFREYDVPVDTSEPQDYIYNPNDGRDWSYGTPSKFFGHVGVHDAQADFYGHVWFTHADSSRTLTIGQMNEKTGAYKGFKFDEPQGYASQAHGMTRDQDGVIWFNSRPAGQKGVRPGLGRMDPKTEQMSLFIPPDSMSSTSGTIDVDSDHKVWVTAPDGALRFDPITQTFKDYKSPTYKTATGIVSVYGLAGDRNGNGWWLGMNQDIVNYSDIKTQTAHEFRLPADPTSLALQTDQEKEYYKSFTPPDFNTPLPWAQGARRMGADHNGHIVWIGDGFSGNYARVDINTKAYSFVPTPSPISLQPYAVAIDRHHDVWTNFWSTDAIGRYDDKTKKWTVFDLPTRGTESRYISVLEQPEGMKVIIPYYRTRKVAVMTFRNQAEIIKLKHEFKTKISDARMPQN